MREKRPREEETLLSMLKNGLFDGVVGKVLTTSGGSNVWTEIRNGEPTRYKKGPGGKFFNGKENERYEGKLHILETWKTDEEKIGFLQKYGWLIEDVAAKKYSAKYK